MAQLPADVVATAPSLEEDTPQLQALVDTIVQVAQPKQVILFGSRATGQARLGSDYDFLVVVHTTRNERQVTGLIYQALLARRLGVAADVIVVSADTLENNKDNPLFVYRQALLEGRVVYGPPGSR